MTAHVDDADAHIDAFVGETWRDGGRFFFSFAKEDGELLDS
jgi:hypothetical protein